VTGEVATREELVDAGDWRRGLREPVRFRAAIDALIARGANTFVEIGGSPVLLGMGRACTTRDDLAWVASLAKGKPDREHLLEAVAELYTSGVSIAWPAFHARERRRRIAIPTYRFQRDSYWDPGNAKLAPGVRGARPAPRTVPASGGRARIAAAPPEQRAALVGEHLARLVASAIGASDIGPSENLIDRGIDSLRAMQLLADLRRTLGVASATGDFMARPTIAAFAEHVANLIAPSAHQPAWSPLVTIRAEGTQPPLYCFHPAGGHATPYLRLRELFGADQPIHAIQSRALGGAAEHASIAAMARDYAELIAGDRVRLLGWSLGGLVAHAVAAELEQRGVAVDFVAMIDVPEPGRALAAGATALAVTGIIYDVNPSPPDPRTLLAALGSAPPDLHAWCEQRGFLPAGALDASDFAAAEQLYRHHAALVATHTAPHIAAPLAMYWASAARDWLAYTSGAIRSRVLGGTHYTIIRPPLVEQIVADLMS
jgi:thioesterase domain-containing protein/aryl carrier-like protein